MREETLEDILLLRSPARLPPQANLARTPGQLARPAAPNVPSRRAATRAGDQKYGLDHQLLERSGHAFGAPNLRTIH